MSAEPLDFEYADDPRAYRAERAAAERTLHRARGLVAALIRATGAAPLEFFGPTRAQLEVQRARITMYAGKALELRASAPSWRPNALFLSFLRGSSVAWADVEARMAELEDERAEPDAAASVPCQPANTTMRRPHVALPSAPNTTFSQAVQAVVSSDWQLGEFLRQTHGMSAGAKSQLAMAVYQELPPPMNDRMRRFLCGAIEQGRASAHG